MPRGESHGGRCVSAFPRASPLSKPQVGRGAGLLARRHMPLEGQQTYTHLLLPCVPHRERPTGRSSGGDTVGVVSINVAKRLVAMRWWK